MGEQWWNAHKATTQSDLNSAYAPYHFDLSEAYASVVKTVAIALLFGQMSPLVYPFSAITMGILYGTWKYKLVYQSRQPPLFSSALRDQFRKIVLVLLMAHIIVGCFVYKQNPCAAKFKAECTPGGPTSDCGNTGGAVAVGLIGSLALLVYLFLPASCYEKCFECCLGKEQKLDDADGGMLDVHGNSRLFPGSVTAASIEVAIKEKQNGKDSWTYKLPDLETSRVEHIDIASPRSKRAHMPAPPTVMPAAPQPAGASNMPPPPSTSSGAAPQQAGGSNMPPPSSTSSAASGGQPAHVQAAIYTPAPIAPQPAPGPSASFQPPPPQQQQQSSYPQQQQSSYAAAPPPPPPQGATFM